MIQHRCIRLCHLRLFLLIVAPLVSPLVDPKPRIYVYPISSRFRNETRLDVTPMYSSEVYFPQMLMASPYYESDPYKADYYYVHSYQYHTSASKPIGGGSGDDGKKRMSQLIEELRTKGPWWDQKNHSHIFAFPYDCGFCKCMVRPHVHGAAPLVKDSIIFQHWGSVMAMPDFYSPYCRTLSECPPDKAFGMLESHPVSLKASFPCYVRGKDLLVPFQAHEDPKTTRFLNPKLDEVPKTKLLFFGGAIAYQHCWPPTLPSNCAEYSGGVRQTVYQLFQNDSRFIFVEEGTGGVINKKGYFSQLASATFCLSPYGTGFGTRTKSSIVRGCIPVIIQDGIKVEWEDELPFPEFALRIPAAWMSRLPEILEHVIKTGKVLELQQNLRCIWTLFWWSKPYGQAFEMTMCVLRARKAGVIPTVNWQNCTLTCTPSDIPIQMGTRAQK